MIRSIKRLARPTRTTSLSNDLPEGYDTRVGESGGRLSGGQRQRIALARALLRNPDILILDEATSGIDAQSEKLIYESIRRDDHRQRITLIIAHRPAALAIADRVIVLSQGEIVLDSPAKQALLDAKLEEALHAPLRRTA